VTTPNEDTANHANVNEPDPMLPTYHGPDDQGMPIFDTEEVVADGGEEQSEVE
jgi:hypothetical protein